MIIDSPVGKLKIVESELGVSELIFGKKSEEKMDSAFSEAAHQIKEYFDGKRKVFELKLDLKGTDFQLKVWNELLKIPYGKTISYEDLAMRLGDEKVIRAAASANGKNPIPILVPCHRVIGKDGSLTGYSGQLWRKEMLLRHEGVLKQTTIF
ncbi:MAG: methylated-DNA--[protein]-cysteine S-methyltransferase [Flavobacteriales bacterium]|nr:methylated-DNA--[protein]-cysteine S-methyltransferase [Flavobacteriales bacterium]